MRVSTQFADTDAVRDYATGLTFQQLQCRDFGHNWRPHTAMRRDDGGFDRTLVCKCKARRVQVLDSYGRIVATHYEYPDGYQMPKGSGRISSDDKGILRIASIEQDVANREERSAARRKAPSKTATRRRSR
ncbi:hypothetical protein [Phaeacidiphilus oryzae]|jgi:hypothetical protein|uniref:hypothetical protein n=1 Tax=Phaeacidiphilus oryzae TaxID=348818 RepID=UPI000560D994|nr:hypothetical protein [Phaeacidiphilus oryzae]